MNSENGQEEFPVFDGVIKEDCSRESLWKYKGLYIINFAFACLHLSNDKSHMSKNAALIVTSSLHITLSMFQMISPKNV